MNEFRTASTDSTATGLSDVLFLGIQSGFLGGGYEGIAGLAVLIGKSS